MADFVNNGVREIDFLVSERRPHGACAIDEDFPRAEQPLDDRDEFGAIDAVTLRQNPNGFAQHDNRYEARRPRRQLLLDQPRRRPRLSGIVLRQKPNQNIGVERDHCALARRRIAASIASRLTGFSGAGTTPFSRPSPFEAGRIT